MTKEDNKEMREWAASRAETNEDAAVEAVLPELDGIFFSPKRRAKNGSEGFSWWERCLFFTPYWLWNEFSYQRGRIDLSIHNIIWENVLYGLFPRSMCEVNEEDLVPSCWP